MSVKVERVCSDLFHVIQEDEEGVSVVLLHTSDIHMLLEKAAPELLKAA